MPGLKRRLRLETATLLAPTEFEKNVTCLFKRGKVNATNVASLASSSTEAKVSFQRLGAGKCARNASRSLLRALRKNTKLPPVCVTETTFWDSKTLKKVKGKLAQLAPHEVLDNLVDAGDEDRWTSCGAGQDGYAEALREWTSRLGVSKKGPPYSCSRPLGRQCAVHNARFALSPHVLRP